MRRPKLVFMVHNIRSAHNVGSILRSADGFSIEQVYLTGYTPYPKLERDQRLPHLAQKIHHKIAKTALGAEKTVNVDYQSDIMKLIDRLKTDGYEIVALEQAPKSEPISQVRSAKMAVIVGREVEGLEAEILAKVDKIIEIPMSGTKESLNVAVAAAIMMYELRRP